MTFINIRSKINSLRHSVKTWRYSQHHVKRYIYYTTRTIWALTIKPGRFLISPNYRYRLYLKYFKQADVHQISNYTEFDRYPDLFSVCQKYMKGNNDLRILSFGCSTGEEVFTLRRYFPNADIVGVDINSQNIKKALRQNSDDRIHFSDNVFESLEKYGPFDLIFALAVFQRTENRDQKTLNSTDIYPFEKFNTTLTMLDKHLKENGLFVLEHADYRFEDTDIFTRYCTLKGEHNVVHERYLFDKYNRKMSEYTLHHRLFIKVI